MKSDYSALSQLIAKNLNKAFNLYAWEDSEEEACQIVNDGIKELEEQHREMRSLLLKLNSARIGMNGEAIIKALDDIDNFFKEDNLN